MIWSTPKYKNHPLLDSYCILRYIRIIAFFILKISQLV